MLESNPIDVPEISEPEYGRTDFRRHPERYGVRVGKHGVLVEPYKAELLL